MHLHEPPIARRFFFALGSLLLFFLAAECGRGRIGTAAAIIGLVMFGIAMFFVVAMQFPSSWDWGF